MTPARWIAVVLGFRDLIDRQENDFLCGRYQLRCESQNLRLWPTKNRWANVVFFQVGMTPSGRMTVVLGFRDLIHCQEALLIAIVNIHTCFIDVEEQAKYRQRPCLNTGLYDIVGHQVVQLLHDIDKA